MNYLYNSETIYQIADAKQVVTNLLSFSKFIFCRQTDLSDGGAQLLEQIMGALNWSKDVDYTIIELDNVESLNFSSCLQSDDKLILSFGLEEKELCLQAQAPYYAKARFENATLIRSHSIKELKANKEHKGALWSAIKEFKKGS